MDGRCKNCKWWYDKGDFHIYRRCMILDGDDGDPSKAAAYGRADDLEIRTGPEFGCIHHEPKG